jgi:hypothetical protein
VSFETFAHQFSKLWLNIENIITGKAYIFEYWMLSLQMNQLDSQYFIENDLAHMLNFAYKFNLTDNLWRLDRGKDGLITEDILKRLIFIIDENFVNKYKNNIDNKLIKTLEKNK